MKDEIRQLVQEYLEKLPTKHSDVWVEKMVERIQNVRSEYPEQHILPIYNKMISELRDLGTFHAERKYPNLQKSDIDDIVQNAFENNFLVKFEKGRMKNEERGWIKSAVEFTILSHFKDTKKRGEIPKDFSTWINSFVDDEEVVKEHETDKVVEKALNEKDEEVEDSNRINVLGIDSISREILLKKTLEIHNESTVYFLDRMYWLTKPEQYNVRKTVDGEPIYDYGERARMEQIIRIDKEKNAAKLDAPDLYLKRHRVIKNASDIYYYMELCIELLKNSKEKFEKEIKQGYFEKSKKRTIPMLSAVAVDKEGILIGSCYKGEIESKTTRGERRTFQKHCEYSLFEEVITSAKDKERLKGGTLFVTLEPCNKRDPFSSAHGEKIPKIPCAVRCLEAGISKIYIGMFDTNKDIKYQGYNILKTGEYTFELENGCLDEKQIPLEDYFKKKKYKLLSDEKDKRVYKIHEGLGDNVLFFDDDLREEICELNATFLRFYDKDGIFV